MPCVRLTSESSVRGNLFGGDDDERNSFEIVKWLTPLDYAISILTYCINLYTLLLYKFIGNLCMELCENIDFAMCEINFWKISASHPIFMTAM